MLHGNIFNINNLIRPLTLTGGGIFLVFVILSNILEDSSDPRYANVMQVLPKEANANDHLSDDELFIEPVAINVPLLGSLTAIKSEENIPPMQVSYAQVEYALRLVKLDSFGQLILNASAEASLSRSVARLPADLSEAQIVHIKQLIQRSLPGGAGNQVADVFSKYYRYKTSEKALMMNLPRPDDIDTALEQLATMTDLRYEMMGGEYAEKLFGEQQRRAEHHLVSEIVRRDNTISAEEKDVQLGQLKKEAQNKGLVFSSPSTEVQQLNADIDKMRTDSQDETMIQARREQLLGRVAAEQLSLMESQQNDWQLRYQKFDQEKAFILAAALDDDEREQQLDRLFLRHYSVEELPGARAYDQKFTR